jgi:hypothetical protein
MFEKEIIDIIACLPENNLLSAYRGRPSIFSGCGPEDVDFPYVVINIEELSPPDSIITRFQIDANVFDYGTSEKTARDISFCISNAIDNIRINNARFTDIRIRRGIRFKIDVPDPRGIHYLVRFDARGSRFYWTKNL